MNQEIVERLREAIGGVLNSWDVSPDAQREIIQRKLMPEIERLLADERAQAEVDTKVYWGIELECDHVRMNLVHYPETDLTICRACVSEKKAVEAERERLRKMLALIYGKYEDGPDCYEQPDEEAGYIGKAVQLTEAEENQIIAALDLTTSLAPSTDEGKGK